MMDLNFPAETVDGEIVKIVRKEANANLGTMLFSDDGRVFQQHPMKLKIVEVEEIVSEAAEEIVDAVKDGVSEAKANLAPVVERVEHRIEDAVEGAVEGVKDALTGDDSENGDDAAEA